MKTSFSFFSPVRGGPGEIRGIQMATHLQGRFNPKSDYENDVCVYVLGTTPEKEPECSYHDVLDGGLKRLARVIRRTRGPLIAVSKEHEAALSECLGTRPVYLIPQHHCNFENEMRPDRPVRTVGCIGGDSCIQWPHHAMDRMMREIGMEWRYCGKYNRRRYVVDFYRDLDVQVSWRPTHARGIIRHMNVLKLSNAGSFGIPTVAYPEPAYTREWKNECIFADTITDLVYKVRQLKDNPVMYSDASALALEKAKDYHIDRIGELYRSLPS